MNRLTLYTELDLFSLEGFHTRHPAIDLSSSTQILCDQSSILIQEADLKNTKEDLWHTKGDLSSTRNTLYPFYGPIETDTLTVNQDYKSN